MSNEEFRDDIRSAIRRHDPSADELRDLAADLERLADRFAETEEVV